MSSHSLLSKKKRWCDEEKRRVRRIWSRLLAFGAALFLLGCSSDAHIYRLGLFGQNVVGDEAYVTVSNVWNEMDGLPLAEKHCKQYGRVARFTHMEGYRAIYDCVKPN